jgi:DNA-binding MarR family transcriptional regulator
MAEADVAVSASLGVSAGDYLALKHVLARPGELGPVELGRVLGMSSGSATALVDRLERAGHLRRRPHPRDRRRRVLVVGAGTQEHVRRELVPLGVAVDRLAAGFDHDQRSAIEQFLRAAAACHRDPARRGPGP